MLLVFFVQKVDKSVDYACGVLQIMIEHIPHRQNEIAGTRLGEAIAAGGSLDRRDR